LTNCRPAPENGKRAFNDQPIIGAILDSAGLQQRTEFVRPGHLEHSLDDTLVRALAQKSFIGALAQEPDSGRQ